MAMPWKSGVKIPQIIFYALHIDLAVAERTEQTAHHPPTGPFPV